MGFLFLGRGDQRRQGPFVVPVTETALLSEAAWNRLSAASGFQILSVIKFKGSCQEFRFLSTWAVCRAFHAAFSLSVTGHHGWAHRMGNDRRICYGKADENRGVPARVQPLPGTALEKARSGPSSQSSHPLFHPPTPWQHKQEIWPSIAQHRASQDGKGTVAPSCKCTRLGEWRWKEREGSLFATKTWACCEGFVGTPLLCEVVFSLLSPLLGGRQKFP